MKNLPFSIHKSNPYILQAGSIVMQGAIKRNETKRKPSKQLIAIPSINQHPIRSDMISYVMGICHSHMYVRDEVYNITFLT